MTCPDYLALTQLKSLKLDMERTREKFKTSICRDFRRFAPEQAIDGEGTVDALRSACEVIAVLGADEREELITWMAGTLLQAYGSIFGAGGPKSNIEHLEHRFEWLKNSSTRSTPRASCRAAETRPARSATPSATSRAAS